MPTWANQTYRRAVSVYSGIIDKVYENRSREVVIKDLLVRSEILKRDFSKRQTNILWMIFTFSYAYGKEDAVIPKLQDFELCGVSKTNIKKELDKLTEMNVISWNEEENRFSINQTTDWEAPYQYGYSDVRSQELFFLNLKDAGVEGLEEIIKKAREQA
jgi:hypothetical protein